MPSSPRAYQPLSGREPLARGQLRQWDCVGVWGCQTEDMDLSSHQGEWDWVFQMSSPPGF